jgi:structural maintenance of chromosome 2
MALLQFKSAPMYILDEIDAALDLSHTHQVGTLFRTRFRGAQFIVLSLKDGLFTNVNIFFRMRFSHRTSVVERTAQRSASALYGSAEREEGAARGGGAGAVRPPRGCAKRSCDDCIHAIIDWSLGGGVCYMFCTQR